MSQSRLREPDSTRGLVETLASLDPEYQKSSGCRGKRSYQSTFEDWEGDRIDAISAELELVNQPELLHQDYLNILQGRLDEHEDLLISQYQSDLLEKVDNAEYREAFDYADRIDQQIKRKEKRQEMKEEVEETVKDLNVMLNQITAQIDGQDQIKADVSDHLEFGR